MEIHTEISIDTIHILVAEALLLPEAADGHHARDALGEMMDHGSFRDGIESGQLTRRGEVVPLKNQTISTTEQSKTEENRAKLTRYQTLSQARGMMRMIVGQAYWQVMMMMLTRVMYIARVMLMKKGIKISTLV